MSPETTQQARLSRARASRNAAAFAACLGSSSAEVVAVVAPDEVADEERLAGLLAILGGLRRSGMRQGEKGGEMIVRKAGRCDARGCGRAARVGIGSREGQGSDWLVPGEGFGLALTGMRRG